MMNQLPGSRPCPAIVLKSKCLQKKPRTGKLPRILRPFFWDYRFASLRWDKDRDLIVDRILTVGSWDGITWLRARFPDRELRAWIERRCGAGLSPRQLRFWELLLGLPHRLVNQWLAAPGRATRDRRALS
jgi:hypothetical protein